MHFKKYCEKLDLEIEDLVMKEAKNGINWQNEQKLHVLLENRKHIKHFKTEKTWHDEVVGDGVGGTV